MTLKMQLFDAFYTFYRFNDSLKTLSNYGFAYKILEA